MLIYSLRIFLFKFIWNGEWYFSYAPFPKEKKIVEKGLDLNTTNMHIKNFKIKYCSMLYLNGIIMFSSSVLRYIVLYLCVPYATVVTCILCI